MDSNTTNEQIQMESEGTVEPLSNDAIDMEKAQRGARLLLEAVGEDPDNGALDETWQRRVPETLATLTAGTRPAEKPSISTFEAENQRLVVKTDIPIYSLCEHHLLPFYGVAHVAYRPDSEVIGLSKLPRYVRWQSRQLTMQEELTHEIATGLQAEIGAEAVLVEISATHLCEAMRGVERATQTTTTAEAGEPTDEDRQQFRRTIDNS